MMLDHAERDGPLPGALPRRVLMTTDALGGIWTFALELAQALAGQGVEVALATMGLALGPEQRAAALSIPALTLHESQFRLEWMDNSWVDVKQAGQWLLERIARRRGDGRINPA